MRKNQITWALKLVFVLTMVGFCMCAAAQSYLSEIDFNDTIPLNNSGEPQGFSSLDSQLTGKQIFLAGENHTYLESNSKLWVRTIQYLHKHAGVRTVMMEQGRSLGWLVNAYIQSGDEKLFKVIEKYAFQEYADGYKELMRFNQTLDSTEKIRVVGIDLERAKYASVKVLSMLIPDGKQAPDSIDLHIESIEGMAMYQDRELFFSDHELEEDDDLDLLAGYFGFKYSVDNTLSRVVRNFKSNEAMYKQYLDSNFDLFREILMGLEDAKYWTGLGDAKAVQDYIYREKYMYNRFLEEYAKGDGGYYGQFGRCHATKKKADKNSCQWYVFKSLAHRIRQSNRMDLSDKVMTFGIMYDNEDYEEDGWGEADDHISDLFEYLDDGRLMLYNLDRDTILRNFFSEDFDHLFLNSCNPNKDHPYYAEDLIFDYEPSGQVLKVMYSYGMYQPDLQSIAALHSLPNQTIYDAPLVVQGGVLSISDEDYNALTSATFIGSIKPVTSTESDSFGTVSTRLGGWVYNSVVSWDFLSKVKFLDVSLGWAFGYNQLNYKISRDNASEGLPVTSGFVGERGTTVYKNPGITTSLLFGLDINIGSFTIGGEVGSTYDLSRKHWRVDGDRLSTGPKTSLRGMFTNLHAGFNFDL